MPTPNTGRVWRGTESGPRSGELLAGWWAAPTPEHEPSGPFDTRAEARAWLAECDE